jgi:hypothetical protein
MFEAFARSAVAAYYISVYSVGALKTGFFEAINIPYMVQLLLRPQQRFKKPFPRAPTE